MTKRKNQRRLGYQITISPKYRRNNGRAILKKKTKKKFEKVGSKTVTILPMQAEILLIKLEKWHQK